MIAVEYPSYGLYRPSPEINENSIKEDADIIYNFLRHAIGLSEKQIIVFGRSIGSGPAVHLASKYEPLMICLFSPFKSVREAAAHLTFNILAKFIKDKFRNIDLMDKVGCPLLIIHGKKDKIVPLSHSEELLNKCASPKKQLTSPDNMSHNDFDMTNDLLNPLLNFFLDNNLHKDELPPVDTRLFLAFRISTDKK